MRWRKIKHTTQVTQLAQDPQLLIVGIKGQESSWSSLKPCVFYMMPYCFLTIGLFHYFCLYFPDFSMGTCLTGLDLGQSVLCCETQGTGGGRGVPCGACRRLSRWHSSHRQALSLPPSGTCPPSPSTSTWFPKCPPPCRGILYCLDLSLLSSTKASWLLHLSASFFRQMI